MEIPDQDLIHRRSPGKTVSALIFLAAYLCAITALSIDLVFWIETPLLAEGVPNFGDLHPLRTSLLALAAAFTVLGLSTWGLGRRDPSESYHANKKKMPGVPAEAEGQGKWVTAVRPGFIHWGILGAGLSALLLFVAYPGTFLTLQNEDRVVEVGSALFLFAACFVSLQIFWHSRKSNLPRSRLYAGTALFFAFSFFLIGMEEVSWFQRVLSIETPAALAVSPRDELNLHNLATDLVENAYYGGAFVFLVLLPFINEQTGLLRKFRYAQHFLPSSSVLLAGSLAMAYNYDMWNILFTQLAFFLTLFILVYKAWAARQFKIPFIYLTFLTATLVLTQVLFLALGDRFIQGWEVTEYKELLIPFVFLLYSTEVYQRTRAIPHSVVNAREEMPASLIPSA